MGNFRRRPVAGDPWVPSAERDRYLLEAADIVHRRSPARHQSPPPEHWAGGVVLVHNLGDAAGPHEPLSVTEATIDPDAAEDAFRERVLLDAMAPESDTPVAITLAPIRSGEIGPAVVSGVVQCKVTGEGAYAVIDDDGVLVGTDDATSVQVLWRAAGSGAQWALVHLGTTGTGEFSTIVQLIPWGFGTDGEVELNWTIPVPPSYAPASGSFTLPWDATQADLRAKLLAHGAIDGDPTLIRVSGGPWPHTALSVQFKGRLANREIDLPVVDVLGLTGGAFPQVLLIRQIVNPQSGSGGGGVVDAGEILTLLQTVDGSGSGLDADMIDGVHLSSLVQTSDVGDTVQAHSENLDGFSEIDPDGVIQATDVGVTVQAYSELLDEFASLTAAANTLPYFDDEDSVATTALTSAGRGLIGASDLAAQKAILSVDDLVTLSGVADGASDFGAFSGSTIPDNQTAKQALQALEAAVESVQGALDGKVSEGFSGQQLGQTVVATTESTTAPHNTAQELSTLQRVTITLAETTDVIVSVGSVVGVANLGHAGVLMVDPGDGPVEATRYLAPFAISGSGISGVVKFTLAAGTHTLKLMFRTSSADQIGTFARRFMIVQRA